jgi:ribosome-associated protein
MEGVLKEQLNVGAARAQAGGAPMMAQAAADTGSVSQETLDLVLRSLDDDKGEEIVSVDLRGKSPVADHMVIASGRSSRQVSAMAEKLMERIKERFGRNPRVEGKDVGDWVLIDCGDVIVHLFRPEVRAFYQLEKMWASPADTRARAISA